MSPKTINLNLKKAILFLSLAWMSSCSFFDNGYNLYIQFDDVDGLQKGAKVSSSGLEIGKVTDLSLSKGHAFAKIHLDKKVQIPFESTFSIKQKNILGGKEIAVDFNKKMNLFLENNDTIKGVAKKQTLPFDIEGISGLSKINMDSIITTMKPQMDSLGGVLEDFVKELDKKGK